LYELHYHLGIAYRQQEELARAKKHYQKAVELEILPQLKLGAWNNLGGLLKDEGDLVGAKNAFLKALEIDGNFATGFYNLGMTLKAMGVFGEAIACYQRAIELNPNYAEAYQNLGVVLLKVGRVRESLEGFKRAIALHEKANSPEAKRLREGLKSMGFVV
jgi:tetratricopeptide (TPR) repeat protein